MNYPSRMRFIGVTFLSLLLICQSGFAYAATTYIIAIHQINSDDEGYTTTCSNAVHECSVFMKLNTPRDDKNLIVRISPKKDQIDFKYEWAGKNLDAAYEDRSKYIKLYPDKPTKKIVQLIVPDAAMEQDRTSHLYHSLVIHKSNDLLAELEIWIKSEPSDPIN